MMLLLCALVVGSVSAWADTTYKLTQVTSVSAGNKYVFEQNDRVLNNTVSSNALQTTDDYSTTGLAGNETYIWELESATGGFYLKNVSLNSNQYLNNSSSTNVSFGAKNSIWSIAFTNNVALISNVSNNNRFLGDNGNNAYKAYASTNLSSYPHDFTVYLVEEEVEVISHTLSTAVTPESTGTVSPSSPTSIAEDGTTTITATANPGYRFVSWSVSGTGSSVASTTSPSTTFTMGTADAIVTANFVETPTYKIKWSVNGTIVKTENIEEGAALEFPAVDDLGGYTCVGWIVDGGNEADYVTSATSVANVTYLAVFGKITSQKEDTWTETALDGLEDYHEIFAIVGNVSGNTYALPNDGGTTTPLAVPVTISGKTLTTEADVNTLKWNVSYDIDNDVYTFYPNGDKKSWLYLTNKNDGVRIGTGSAKHFSISSDGYLTTEETTNQRYLGIYNSQDWRCYENTSGNIAGQTFKLYVFEEGYIEYGYLTTTIPPATVRVTDAGYATFSTSETAVNFKDTGIKAYIAKFAKFKDDKYGVIFTQVDKVPANTGVLLYKDGGTGETPAVIPAMVGGIDPDVYEDNVFVPGKDDTVPTIEPSNSNLHNFILNKIDGVIGFYQAAGKMVEAGKAYIQVDYSKVPINVDEVKGFIALPGFEDETAVNEIVNGQSINGKWYNLAGQRVNKAQKGIFIVNGKKVVK